MHCNPKYNMRNIYDKKMDISNDHDMIKTILNMEESSSCNPVVLQNSYNDTGQQNISNNQVRSPIKQDANVNGMSISHSGTESSLNGGLPHDLHNVKVHDFSEVKVHDFTDVKPIIHQDINNHQQYPSAVSPNHCFELKMPFQTSTDYEKPESKPQNLIPVTRSQTHSRRSKEPTLNQQFPSKLQGVELRILEQPEEQHRARYLTEGSRGAVKNRSQDGHPLVKLFGYEGPAVLQVFVGNDTGRVKPHGFYQACKVAAQPIGQPEACKLSRLESTVDGGEELFIIVGPCIKQETPMETDQYQKRNIPFTVSPEALELNKQIQESQQTAASSMFQLPPGTLTTSERTSMNVDTLVVSSVGSNGMVGQVDVSQQQSFPSQPVRDTDHHMESSAKEKPVTRKGNGPGSARSATFSNKCKFKCPSTEVHGTTNYYLW
ncbi:hypothetical protein KUTeg_018830 [Tegillarca granosa]|uniref:RHD domain-containing protein n=1 Tax=Tegillarca granosa TaxID=220873 RepID=A0ABQ9EAR4_TEGGR|nr:hypothetical protein KUTeg_018830 [Tegillarca granosa]